MRKIAKLKWNIDTGEYSKTEFNYIGYFHKWVISNKELYAVTELEDGTIVLNYFKYVKFIETPKC